MILVRRVPLVTRAMSSSTPAVYNFETLRVTRPKEFVVQVEVNRPDKRNAQNSTFYRFFFFKLFFTRTLLLIIVARLHHILKQNAAHLLLSKVPQYGGQYVFQLIQF